MIIIIYFFKKISFLMDKKKDVYFYRIRIRFISFNILDKFPNQQVS